MKKGFSLVECMLAGSITCLMVLVLFEGIIVAGRIAHENSQYLAASDYAFDLAWQKFNSAQSTLNAISDNTRVTENLSSNAVPVLYYANSPAVSYITYRRVNQGETNGIFITVNVEWGPVGNRKRLSNKTGTAGASSLNQELTLFRTFDTKERGYSTDPIPGSNLLEGNGP